MYDYIRALASGLTSDELIDVFDKVLLLNNTPICKEWESLIACCGVEGMLHLADQLGGKTITFPTLYQVLTVYAAIIVSNKMEKMTYEEAVDSTIGRLHLEGFKELVERIRDLAERNPAITEPQCT